MCGVSYCLFQPYYLHKLQFAHEYEIRGMVPIVKSDVMGIQLLAISKALSESPLPYLE